jgi:hypothetical protein
VGFPAADRRCRPEEFTPTIRAVLFEAPMFLSVLTFWKVMLETTKGGLNVRDPFEWWNATTEVLVADVLLPRPQHITAVYNLPAFTKIHSTVRSSRKPLPSAQMAPRGLRGGAPATVKSVSP